MSSDNLGGIDQRLLELYRQGAGLTDMARDSYLVKHFLSDLDTESSRRWRCWSRLRSLLGRDEAHPGPREDEPAEPVAPSKSLFEDKIAELASLLGGPKYHREFVPPNEAGRQEVIVISDLHVPYHRRDLIAEICRQHRGKRLVIAGDLIDFESESRYTQDNWHARGPEDQIAEASALVSFLREHFPTIEIILGNHDLRPIKKAARGLGAWYASITHRHLVSIYSAQFGVRLIEHPVSGICGEVPPIHSWHQIGDCVIGHIEVTGKPVARSVQRSAEFFHTWQDLLGISDFRVVLQAHSHRRAYYYDPVLKKHCFEIGALCHQPYYALREHGKYNPVQAGYFHLVQYDGVTSINESRLVCLDC